MSMINIMLSCVEHVKILLPWGLVPGAEQAGLGHKTSQNPLTFSCDVAILINSNRPCFLEDK